GGRKRFSRLTQFFLGLYPIIRRGSRLSGLCPFIVQFVSSTPYIFLSNRLPWLRNIFPGHWLRYWFRRGLNFRHYFWYNFRYSSLRSMADTAQGTTNRALNKTAQTCLLYSFGWRASSRDISHHLLCCPGRPGHRPVHDGVGRKTRDRVGNSFQHPTSKTQSRQINNLL